MELVPYMHIRYIGGPDTLPPWATKFNAAAAIYCTRTFDSMDSYVIATDKVGMSLSTLPSSATPDHFLHTAGLEFGVEGGLAVNQSLMATSNIFAAGDITSVWSNLGRGNFTGYNFARKTGEIAGENMVGGNRLFKEVSTYSTTDCDTDDACAQAALSDSETKDFADLLFIGNCSSSMESHGFWWKLQSDVSSTNTNGSKPQRNASSSSTITASPTLSPDEPLHSAASAADDNFSSRVMRNFYKNIVEGVDGDIHTKAQKHNNLGFKGKRGVRTARDSGSGLPTMNRNLLFGLVFYVDDNDSIVGVLLSGISGISDEISRDKVVEKAKTLVSKKASFSDFREFIVNNEESLKWVDEVRFHSDRLLSIKVLESRALDIISPICNTTTDNRASLSIFGARPTYRNCMASRTAFISDSNKMQTLSRQSGSFPRVFMEPLFQAERSSQMRSRSRNMASLK